VQLVQQHCDAILSQTRGYEQQLAALQQRLAAKEAEAAAKEEELASTKRQLADALAAVERYKTIKAEKLDAQADAYGASQRATKVFALSEQTEAALAQADEARVAALAQVVAAANEVEHARAEKRKAEGERDAESKQRRLLEAQLRNAESARALLTARLAAAQAQLRHPPSDRP